MHANHVYLSGLPFLVSDIFACTLCLCVVLPSQEKEAVVVAAVVVVGSEGHAVLTQEEAAAVQS